LLERASTSVALVSAASAALALVAELFLESRRTSFTCSDGATLALDLLFITILAFSVLALVAGITAIACHTRHTAWVVLAMVSAGTLAALTLVLDALGGYLCESFAF
jgi:hypothetical protein